MVAFQLKHFKTDIRSFLKENDEGVGEEEAEKEPLPVSA